jgi:carboxymethylenebutenolidase
VVEEARAMCSAPDSQPPIEAGADVPASGRGVGLIASDGQRCSAFEADSPSPAGAGIIVLPDYGGLSGFYQELALRFAEVGVDALAIDYYGRTAGPLPRDDTFDHRHHARLTTWAGLQADVVAAAAHLRIQRRVRTLFSIGFCFGGRLSFLLGTLPELSLAGVIGFYGWPVGPFLNDTPAPADLAARLHSPLLGIFGGADDKIPADDIEAFRRALSHAPAVHEIRVYDGAPHSFFDRRQGDFGQASASAWSEVQSFIRAHSTASPAGPAGPR